MNRDYLYSHGYLSRQDYRKSLVERSGNYFERLVGSPVDNQYVLVECVPESRRIQVDQTCVQDFQINEYGWPSSDISMLLKVQTDEQVSSVLNRLVDLKSKTQIPEGTSDMDIIKYHIPSRYLGTSSELLGYIESKIDVPLSSADVQVAQKSPDHIDFAQADESQGAD